jgi:hypothetical protein
MSGAVARLHERFPSIPPAVLLKTELLRRGVRLEDEGVGSRHYHHHDERGQRREVALRAHLQGSVRLPEGPQVFIAYNAGSPYFLRHDAGRLLLGVSENGQPEEVLGEVEPAPQFRWTSARTSRGTPLATIFSPSLGGACGPVALFLLRHCEFAVTDEECRFCSWVRMGKSTEMRPHVDDMREALGAILAEQGRIGYLAFSGGSLYNRTKEADAFLSYMDAVRATGAPLPATVAAIQALDRQDSVRLRQAGFEYACYSMEVWDERVWPEVLPGKARALGRDRWMACLEEAADVFGPGRVMCNFVAGVETAVPGVFTSPEAAADSTLAGMRWCCERGIYPKYAVWIVGGGARFGDRDPAPLEYYVRLLEGRQRLFEEYPALAVPSTDCARCLTQSCEADLAALDPSRYGRGAAAYAWQTAHA